MNQTSQLLDLFVSPRICRLLVERDLTKNVPFHYRCLGEDAELQTFYFDQDDYYAHGHAASAMVGYEAVPAYTVTDMMALLPDYSLIQNSQDGYEIAVSELFNIPSVMEKRLADALAMMVYEGLTRRILKAREINAIIEKQTHGK